MYREENGKRASVINVNESSYRFTLLVHCTDSTWKANKISTKTHLTINLFSYSFSERFCIIMAPLFFRTRLPLEKNERKKGRRKKILTDLFFPRFHCFGLACGCAADEDDDQSKLSAQNGTRSHNCAAITIDLINCLPPYRTVPYRPRSRSGAIDATRKKEENEKAKKNNEIQPPIRWAGPWPVLIRSIRLIPGLVGFMSFTLWAPLPITDHMSERSG